MCGKKQREDQRTTIRISWKGRGKYSFKTKLSPPPPPTTVFVSFLLFFFFYPIYEKGSFQRTRYVVCVQADKWDLRVHMRQREWVGSMEQVRQRPGEWVGSREQLYLEAGGQLGVGCWFRQRPKGMGLNRGRGEIESGAGCRFRQRPKGMDLQRPGGIGLEAGCRFRQSI